jgi:hypothetical protein
VSRSIFEAGAYWIRSRSANQSAATFGEEDTLNKQHHKEIINFVIVTRDMEASARISVDVISFVRAGTVDWEITTKNEKGMAMRKIISDNKSRMWNPYHVRNWAPDWAQPHCAVIEYQVTIRICTHIYRDLEDTGCTPSGHALSCWPAGNKNWQDGAVSFLTT